MENHTQQPPSLIATFVRGFLKSAATGALMSSIYYGLGFGLQAAGFNLLHLAGVAEALPIMAFMVGVVGLFGGVMAVVHAQKSHEHEQGHEHSRAPARERSRNPEMTPVMVPTPVLAEQAETTAPEQANWVERTGRGASNDNYLQGILARNDLSDKDRASAILAERDAATSAVTQR